MYIVHVIEPFASGVAVFVKLLAQHLDTDHHIIVHGERKSVASASAVKKTFALPNVRFIAWKNAGRKINFWQDTKAAIQLFSIIKKLQSHKKLDAVHLHSSKSGFIGRLVCRLAGVKKVIYTPNGAPFLSSSSPFTNKIYKYLERLGSTFGGQVVCCSTTENAAYQEAGMNALTINNGVSITQKLYTTIVKKTPGKFRVITSARICHQKNPESFNAIAQHFEALNDFEFIWVGDGEKREALTAKNITVTGWQPAEEAMKLIATADLFISTSHFEGLAFSVLEAMAINKPVLLKDCIGNRDVIRSGHNGDIFSTEEEAINRICQYYNNRAMLPLMGSFAKELCEDQFNIKHTSQQYHKLYAGK